MEKLLTLLGGGILAEDYKRYKKLRGIGFWKLCIWNAEAFSHNEDFA